MAACFISLALESLERKKWISIFFACPSEQNSFFRHSWKAGIKGVLVGSPE